MGSAQNHRVLNVYGADNVDTVENAIEMVKEVEDVESDGEALAMLAEAYTGWSADG